jgi:hypothetical protein
MGTYFKAWNALVDAPDPDAYIPEEGQEVGFLGNGKPIRQGFERGTIVWSVMTLAHYIDLWDAYNTDKDNSGTFIIPPHTSGGSWTSWRSVTAWAISPPKVEYRGRVCQNVTMRILITA